MIYRLEIGEESSRLSEMCGTTRTLIRYYCQKKLVSERLTNYRESESSQKIRLMRSRPAEVGINDNKGSGATTKHVLKGPPYFAHAFIQ